jgi:hypothetical protein
MPKANRSKSAAFSVHTCPHCGRRTRGPAHFRHEQACRSRGGALPAQRRGRIRRNARPTGQFFEQLRRLVAHEVRRQLGFLA